MKKFLIIGLLLSIFLFKKGFSQQTKEIIPFYPSRKDSPLEDMIEKEKVAIKKSGYFSRLKNYASIRQEDVFLCDDEDCKRGVLDLLAVRYWGEGRCEEISQEQKKEICQILKDGSYNTFSDWKKDFCQALIEGDENKLTKVMNSRECLKNMGSSYDKVSINDAFEILAIYFGFKYYSAVSCERYLKKKASLGRRISCEILFASDPNAKIEDIIRDFAIFNISRDKQDYNLCNNIKNINIRNTCLNKTIKNLREIW